VPGVAEAAHAPDLLREFDLRTALMLERTRMKVLLPEPDAPDAHAEGVAIQLTKGRPLHVTTEKPG
jgi:hypothetical protein